MAALLRRVYASEVAQVRAAETSLDVIAAIISLEEATTGKNFNCRGFGLTQAERRAVGLRAMAVAMEYFQNQGFRVEDTSAEKPYDLTIRCGELINYVEVKGTTGLLGDIVLTKNEVTHHVKQYPRNTLFVLHEISLNKSKAAPLAEGGKIHVQIPWMINTEQLSPIAYRYRIS